MQRSLSELLLFYISACRDAGRRSTKKNPSKHLECCRNYFIAVSTVQSSPALCTSPPKSPESEVLFLTLVMSQNCIGYKGSKWFTPPGDKISKAFDTWESLQSILHICFWLSARQLQGQHQLVKICWTSVAHREDHTSLSYLCGVYSITSVNPFIALRICCYCKCRLLFLINHFKTAYNSANTLCSRYTFRGSLCTNEGCLWIQRIQHQRLCKLP